MHTQTLLRIGVPPGKLYPARFRELLAKQPDMPEVLFHRENGQTLSSLPKYCAVGGKGWVGLLVQPGDDSMGYDLAGTVIKAVATEVGQPCPLRIEQHELGAEPVHWPVSYGLREMVIKRRSKTARDTDIESLVKERVLAGLARYASAYAIDLPSNDALDIHVTVLGCKGLQLQVTSGMTREFVSLVDARVSLFCQLKGVWLVGNLTSRGYGRFTQNAGGLTDERAPRDKRSVVA